MTVEPRTARQLTVQTNMEKRRKRILDSARRLLTSVGYEGFNTRDLAKAAGVTTPTLYNLIGTKNQILVALSLESTNDLARALDGIEHATALDFLESIVAEAANLATVSEPYFQAVWMALDKLSDPEKQNEAEHLVSQRCAAVAEQGCRMAQEQDLLKGDIPAQILSSQLFSVFVRPWRDWTYGRCSVAEFERRALQGFYICLCADATTDFLDVLRGKLRAINADETIDRE